MKRPGPRELALLATRRVLGLTAFFYIFYVLAHYVWGLPFPTPYELVIIVLTVSLGVALGVAYSKVWPLPPEPGFERVLRTLLIAIPAIGIGLFLEITLLGPGRRALYLIFALSAWLGSGFIEAEEAEEGWSIEGREEEEGEEEGRDRWWAFPSLERMVLRREEGEEGEEGEESTDKS